MFNMKEIHDQLHDATDTISNEEILPIALKGFSINYEMFVSNVVCRETMLSLEKLYDIFLLRRCTIKKIIKKIQKMLVCGRRQRNMERSGKK